MTKKRALILNTSHNDLYSIKALKQMNFYVIATGGNKGLIGEQFVDEYFQMDYSKKEEILKFAETQNIDYICACCNDFGVMTASFVAEKLGDCYRNVRNLLDNCYTNHKPVRIAVQIRKA